MTLDYLKKLFVQRYGDCVFLKTPVEVLVTLTPEQFKELNDDIMSSFKSSALLIMNDSDMLPYGDNEILFTRISIPGLCELIIDIGLEFGFSLLDSTQEHGDETL